MFCPKCGNQLPEHANFCDVCGSKMKKAAGAPEPVREQKTGKGRYILLAVVGVLLCAGIVGAAFILRKRAGEKNGLDIARETDSILKSQQREYDVAFRQDYEGEEEEIDFGLPGLETQAEGFSADSSETQFEEETGQAETQGEEANITVMRGIDVSKYQGEIDWTAVADSQSVDFALIRLGYRGYESGALVEDEYFASNVTGALSNGIKVGCYFSSTAVTAEEAEEEVAFITERLTSYRIEMPVSIGWGQTDTEDSRTYGMNHDTVVELLSYWCALMEDNGYTAMVAGTAEWLDSQGVPTELKTWVGSHDSDVKPERENMLMWQYTTEGNVAGISGNVDLNYYYGIQ